MESFILFPPFHNTNVTIPGNGLILRPPVLIKMTSLTKYPKILTSPTYRCLCLWLSRSPLGVCSRISRRLGGGGGGRLIVAPCVPGGGCLTCNPLKSILARNDATPYRNRIRRPAWPRCPRPRTCPGWRRLLDRPCRTPRLAGCRTSRQRRRR